MQACNNNELLPEKVNNGVVSGQLMESRGGAVEDSEVSYFSGYFTAVAFDAEGTLVMIRENIKVEQSGKFSLTVGNKSKKCYFIANAPKEVIPDFGVTETEFKEFVMNGVFNTELDPVMLGEIDLDTYHWEPIVMERCVARIDLDMQVSGISVSRITLKEAADRSFLFPHETVSPEGLNLSDITIDFENGGLTESKDRLMYLHEQSSGSPVVVMEAVVDGKMMELKESLPKKIKRNSLYTLKVYGNGAKLNMELQESGWQSGQNTGSSVVALAKVNIENSLLDGARVNEKCDTVFIPFTDKTIALAVNTEEGMTVRSVGSLNWANVTVGQNISRGNVSIDKQTMVNITSQMKRIGLPEQYSYLESVDSNGVIKGRIVLVFEPNPVKMTGLLSFVEDASFDFDGYKDGEYARFIIPEGMKVELEFAPGEDNWAILKDAEDGTGALRLLGGWKPNDSSANGRRQEVTLKISNIDGSDAELYTISRKNYGLPVVNIAGNWWCKYNLRGTANDFEDQILTHNDPVQTGSSLLDYLQSCSDEELMAVMGDQYQGGNIEGLPLALSEGKFIYQGFSSSVSVNINTLAKKMAPEGYEMPTGNDFRRLVASNDYYLQYTSMVYNNNMSGDDAYRLRYYHGNRSVTFEGVSYGTIGFYDFCQDTLEGDNSRHLVICGWGHQWDAAAGSISNDDIIFATNSGSSTSWTMEGWFAENKGNWFKSTTQNNTKTRTIRCKKSPVEYIY